MNLRVRIVGTLVSVAIMLLILELVRRRKLREEYSWLWLVTGSVIVVLMIWVDLLKWITHMVGALVPSSTVFFLAVLFLMLIGLHFSVVISKLTDRNKELAQRFALLEMEIDEMKNIRAAPQPLAGARVVEGWEDG